MLPTWLLTKEALIFKVTGKEYQEFKSIWSVSRNVLFFTIYSANIYLPSVFWDGRIANHRGIQALRRQSLSTRGFLLPAGETAGSARTPRTSQQIENHPPANTREGHVRDRRTSECHAGKLVWVRKTSLSQMLKIAKQEQVASGYSRKAMLAPRQGRSKDFHTKTTDSKASSPEFLIWTCFSELALFPCGLPKEWWLC